MKLLKDIWDALAIIGLGTVVALIWIACRCLAKATASAKKSNQDFRSRTTVSDPEMEDIGAEAWPANHPQ